MLNEQGLAEVIKEEAQKKPLLGICLGMQMLFEKSYEFGETKGLGLIPGCVQLIDGNGLKIPHMGWNDLRVLNPCAMTEKMPKDAYVYFVHSFRAETGDENISCYTVYHERIPALVHRGYVSWVVKIISYLVITAFALICLLPFILIISASFSTESVIMKEGFGLLPKGFTLDTGKTLRKNAVVASP